MVDQVVQDFDKICGNFAEMRRNMRNSQKYSGKGVATDKFYHAIREFASDIGLVAPCIPIDEPETL